MLSKSSGVRENGKRRASVEKCILNVSKIIILIVKGMIKLIRCIIIFCVSNGLKGILDIISICLFFVNIVFVDL